MDIWLEDPDQAEETSCHAALEVMLLLAEADARWGDYRSAVRVLDMATRAVRELPSEYGVKRERWALLRDGDR